METVELGNIGTRITRIGMGGWPLGGHGWGPVDDRESIAAVRRADELGINFFDIADVYGFGHAEQILSSALEERRHEVVIASKFGVRWSADGTTCRDISPAYARQALEASLRRLRLDCIPLYYVHWPDGKTAITDTIEELARLREQGKIRWIGVSNFTADQLREALTVTSIEAVQVQFSLAVRDPAYELLPMLRKTPVTLVTWGSLAQGLLSGKYHKDSHFADNDTRHRQANFQGAKFEGNLRIVETLKKIAQRIGRTPAQVAIRWLLDTPGVGCVLVGAKRPDQIEENASAVGWSLSPSDYRELESLSTEGAAQRVGREEQLS
jgi:myo-inositol catabolism protein IolS